MSSQGYNPLGYTGERASNPPQMFPDFNREPTTQDYRNYNLGDMVRDQNLAWWQLASVANGVAVWNVASGGIPVVTGIETVTANSGTAAPDANHNLNLFGAIPDGLSFEAAGSTVTGRISAASETQRGTLKTATSAETIAGASSIVSVVPTSLAAKLGAQTSNGLPIGAGTSSALAWTAQPIQGQLLIGTGATPVLNNLSSSDGSVAITNGVGTIDLRAVGGGGGVGVVLVNTDSGTFAPDGSNHISLLGDSGQGVSTSGVASTGTITCADATTAQKGVTLLATNAETIAGAVTTKAVTPDDLKAKLGAQTDHGVALGNTQTGALVWTGAPTDGQLLIGSTGSDPSLNTLVSGDGSVTITNGAGTIDLRAAGIGTSLTVDADTGSATPSAGVINFLGTSAQGISSSASGSTVTYTIADASTTQKGVAELATDAETITGSDGLRIVTPSSLSAKLGSQTNHGLPIGAGPSTALSWTAQPALGQLLIGTGSTPVLNNLTSSDGSVAITNGTGTIDLRAVGGGGGVGIVLVQTDSGTFAPDASNHVNLLGDGLQGIETSGGGSTGTITALDASTIQKGVIETATDPDAVAISLSNVAIVPSNLGPVFASPPPLGTTLPNIVVGTDVKANDYQIANIDTGTGYWKILANAAQMISADGTYVIAKGTNLCGLFSIEWDGTDRKQVIIGTISGLQGDNNGGLYLLVNDCLQMQEVFTNIGIALDASNTPALILDVGNRNGSAANMYVQWYAVGPFAIDNTNVELFPAGYMQTSYLHYGGITNDPVNNLPIAETKDSGSNAQTRVLDIRHTAYPGSSILDDIGVSYTMSHQQPDGTIVQGAKFYTTAPNASTNDQTTDLKVQLNKGGTLSDLTTAIWSAIAPGTYGGEFQVQSSDANTQRVGVLVGNFNTTINEGASVFITADPTQATASPYIALQLFPTTTFAWGIDHQAADIFALKYASGSFDPIFGGNSSIMTVDSTGVVRAAQFLTPVTAGAPSADAFMYIEGAGGSDSAYFEIDALNTSGYGGIRIKNVGGAGQDWEVHTHGSTNTFNIEYQNNPLCTFDTSGNVVMDIAGGGLKIKEGANAKMGANTFVGGTVTVSNTAVTANSRIYLSIQSLGTVLVPQAIGITARTPATSFTITSADATDTSVVAWEIIEPS